MHGFGDDGRNVALVLFECDGHGLDVVGVNLNDTFEQCAVSDFVEWQALRTGAAIVGAVVSAVARDDHGAFRMSGLNLCRAGNLHRRINCLGSAAAEKNSGAGNRGQ